MRIKREIVTPYLAFVFAVVALTGILMFFHLLDAYTNVVHEFLGLTFILFALLHVITNWKSLKNYSRKRLFMVQASVVLLVSLCLVIFGSMHGNTERRVIEKLMKAPVHLSFHTLSRDYKGAIVRLKKNNVFINDSFQSLEQLSLINRKSPEEIIELVIE